ncbi:LANO_0E00232g1_1 [Lachancea nothofagi CBS 11611]|uniref:LANO_0E00232g1_1 n=1 Tax=Lachancea nothofagi CBS 11611 TaxID=1266666 RepID=A0A1G4JNR9_9SACH|nr:LANO_0E00232g1_1 [Lachancea nothofagi CBS 11611]
MKNIINQSGQESTKLPDEREKSPIITTVLSLEGELIEVNEKDADQALQYALGTESLELDPEVEKKLIRKIDWCILPIIVALMSCQLMDKTTNSYASIMGLTTDLDMTSQAYSWVGSSFYFGYLIFQFPANLLLQRFPLSKTLGCAVILWGIILMCHAACFSSAPFLVCRVLLGVFEGFMNPAYILLTAQWYKKSEQFMRSCIWFGFQGFGTILGAGIAYGLVSHNNYALSSWRLLYIITGVITIALGIISVVHIPDIPVKAWFLNETEKKYCVERIRSNQQGFGNQRFKIGQLREAFKDLRTLIFFVYGMSYAIPNGGFTNFGSILLHKDFGFSTKESLLMNMPGGGIDIIIPFVVAYISVKLFKGDRLIICFIVNSLVIVGMCLLNFTAHKGSKLAGYLSFYAATAVVSGIVSCISSNTAGHTKKVTVNTIFLIGYCVGNIIGPQSFRANQAPNYAGAKIAMLVSFCMGDVCIAAMYFLNKRDNKIRDEKRASLGEDYPEPDNLAFSDLTDKENPAFRYSL